MTPMKRAQRHGVITAPKAPELKSRSIAKHNIHNDMVAPSRVRAFPHKRTYGEVFRISQALGPQKPRLRPFPPEPPRAPSANCLPSALCPADRRPSNASRPRGKKAARSLRLVRAGSFPKLFSVHVFVRNPFFSRFPKTSNFLAFC